MRTYISKNNLWLDFLFSCVMTLSLWSVVIGVVSGVCSVCGVCDKLTEQECRYHHVGFV